MNEYIISLNSIGDGYITFVIKGNTVQEASKVFLACAKSIWFTEGTLVRANDREVIDKFNFTHR